MYKTIGEKRSQEFEREKVASSVVFMEKEKGRVKYCNFIIISKMKYIILKIPLYRCFKASFKITLLICELISKRVCSRGNITFYQPHLS